MPRNGSSLLFSIEQWELIRRLRNSGLTKEQIGQAFDDLAKIEQDLGSMFNTPTSNLGQNSHPIGNHESTNGSKFNNNHLLNNMQIFQMAKNLSSMTQGRSANGHSAQSNGFSNLSNGTSFNGKLQSDQTSPSHDNHTENSNNSNLQTLSNGTSHTNQQTTAAAAIVNNHFAGLMDPEQELKQIEEFKLKGEVVIHGDISFFVYKHDLKQSQIARMAGVNQAYVSKFLRGEFFDLSENGKSLIYKWYLRFLKNPQIFGQAHNLSINTNLIGATGTSNGLADLKATNHNIKVEANYPMLINNGTSTAPSYDAPRRSRFSFKAEHLVILEKAFIEAQYPDQKKREELAKQCNEAKPCSERVTEQIVTHWFQNKRKITRNKINTDDQSSISPRNNINTLNGTGHHSINNNNTGNSNHTVYHDEYPGGDDSLNDDYRTNDNNSNNDSHNGNNDYQNESLIDYQDFVEDDSDFRSLLVEQPNGRKRAAGSIDY